MRDRLQRVRDGHLPRATGRHADRFAQSPDPAAEAARQQADAQARHRAAVEACMRADADPSAAEPGLVKPAATCIPDGVVQGAPTAITFRRRYEMLTETEALGRINPNVPQPRQPKSAIELTRAYGP